MLPNPDLVLGIQKHHFLKHNAGKDITYSLTASPKAPITPLFEDKVNYNEIYSDSDEESKKETEVNKEREKKDADAENNVNDSKKNEN